MYSRKSQDTASLTLKKDGCVASFSSNEDMEAHLITGHYILKLKERGLVASFSTNEGIEAHLITGNCILKLDERWLHGIIFNK